MNQAAIYRIMKAAFVLHTMLVIAALGRLHSDRTPGVTVFDAFSHHGRSNFLQIGNNLSCNCYVREVLQSEVVSSFKTSVELSFSSIMNAHKLQRLLEISV